MEYLFTEEDTALAFCFLVFFGFVFFQLQKNIISSHIGKFTLPRKKIYLTTGACLALPVIWAFKVFVYAI
jgi:hypothetical protein